MIYNKFKTEQSVIKQNSKYSSLLIFILFLILKEYQMLLVCKKNINHKWMSSSGSKILLVKYSTCRKFTSGEII